MWTKSKREKIEYNIHHFIWFSTIVLLYEEKTGTKVPPYLNSMVELNYKHMDISPRKKNAKTEANLTDQTKKKTNLHSLKS